MLFIVVLSCLTKFEQLDASLCKQRMALNYSDMGAITEDNFLQTCLARIEEKLGWGSSQLWVNQDFENLSEKIEEATGVQLSVTTLKRIWGKVKYKSKPTITTLNALAGFIGFQHWRAFKQSLCITTEERHENIVDEEIMTPAKVFKILVNP